MKKTTIELSKDELSMVYYALKEMGNRRHEQAIDRKSPTLRAQGEMCYELANKISEAARIVRKGK